MIARNVTVIPQTIRPFTGVSMISAEKRKVAAYARVSTDSDEQQTSYEAQVDYYTQYIKSKPEWEFVNVYTDEPVIIGTSGENLVKSRVSALVPFHFLLRASTNSFKSQNISYGRMCRICQKQSQYATRKVVSQRLPLL